MKDESTTIARSWPTRLRHLSWGAVFAGLASALAIQATLTLLGIAIGSASIDPLTERNPVEGIGLGSAIWIALSGALSLLAGSWVAGRLSEACDRMDGLLHGIVTWSAASILTILLAATAAGALVGGVGSLLSQAMGAASREAQGVKQNPSAMASLQEGLKSAVPELGTALTPTGRPGSSGTPGGSLTELAKSDPQLAGALARLEAEGGVSKSPQARDQVIILLTTEHKMDPQQAKNILDQWDQQLQSARNQAERKARETGDKAARGVSRAALWGFIGMVLGACVAAWGGWAGAASQPLQRVETTVPGYPKTTGP